VAPGARIVATSLARTMEKVSRSQAAWLTEVDPIV
jgi:hypothetical protein